MCNLICCGDLQISCHVLLDMCSNWYFIDFVFISKKTLSKCTIVFLKNNVFTVRCGCLSKIG